MKRREVIRGATAVVALASLRVPAFAQSVVLQFPTWQADTPGYGAFFKEAIAAFMQKNPDVSIDLQQIPYADYVNQLTVRFAAGHPPDILVLPTDNFGVFAGQDWLAPLDGRIKGTDIESKWSSLQSELVWNGQTEGVLLMGYGYMLFFNRAILDKAGVAVPTSFEEFRAAVAKTTDRDAGIFGLSAVTTEHPTIALDFIQFIKWQGQDIIRDGHYDLTNPAVVKAIENYRETVGGNAPLGNNSTIARQLFTDGHTAFWIDGPWMYTRMDSAAADIRPHLEMIKAPFEPVLGGASNSIHIPAGLAPEIEERVWDFIAFLAQPEWQQKLLVLTASPPGLQGALTDGVIAAAPYLKTISDAAIGAQPIIPNVPSIRANSSEFSAILRRTALKVISTEEPVASILATAQQELESAVPVSG